MAKAKKNEIKLMNEEYLDFIGVSATLKDRIAMIYEQFSPLFPEEVRDIFITDHIDGEGVRRYDNLWFITKKYVLESKKFTSEENIDFIGLSENVIYINIEKENFDIGTFDEKSRVRVYVSFLHDLRGEFFATGNNCPILIDLTKKYFIEAFKRYSE